MTGDSPSDLAAHESSAVNPPPAAPVEAAPPPVAAAPPAAPPLVVVPPPAAEVVRLGTRTERELELERTVRDRETRIAELEDLNHSLKQALQPPPPEVGAQPQPAPAPRARRLGPFGIPYED